MCDSLKNIFKKEVALSCCALNFALHTHSGWRCCTWEMAFEQSWRTGHDDDCLRDFPWQGHISCHIISPPPPWLAASGPSKVVSLSQAAFQTERYRWCASVAASTRLRGVGHVAGGTVCRGDNWITQLSSEFVTERRLTPTRVWKTPWNSTQAEWNQTIVTAAEFLSGVFKFHPAANKHPHF